MKDKKELKELSEMMHTVTKVTIILLIICGVIFLRDDDKYILESIYMGFIVGFSYFAIYAAYLLTKFK